MTPPIRLLADGRLCITPPWRPSNPWLLLADGTVIICTVSSWTDFGRALWLAWQQRRLIGLARRHWGLRFRLRHGRA